MRNVCNVSLVTGKISIPGKVSIFVCFVTHIFLYIYIMYDTHRHFPCYKGDITHSCIYISCMTHIDIFPVTRETLHTFLFFQNATQEQLHGGKNPIVLYQEMNLQFELHISIEPAAAFLQRFNWSGPPPRTRNFLKDGADESAAMMEGWNSKHLWKHMCTQAAS